MGVVSDRRVKVTVTFDGQAPATPAMLGRQLSLQDHADIGLGLIKVTALLP